MRILREYQAARIRQYYFNLYNTKNATFSFRTVEIRLLAMLGTNYQEEYTERYIYVLKKIVYDKTINK